MTETRDNTVAPPRDVTDHPYYRPKDAATMILIDRSGATPKVLVGKRHEKVVFMPSTLVFPGGRVDPKDASVPVASPIPQALMRRLMQGSPKTTEARARALANAAVREACEETGLCLGRKADVSKAKLRDSWQPFADAGLMPDPSSLYLIARAITPPGRVRRFDTRFFTADASAIAHTVPGIVHADAELVELLWVEIGASPLRAMHQMTVRILDQLAKRLAMGALSHDAPIPFFHFYGGKMQMDTLT
jgi:8-oxo-dGTP pyrophosphatase MutT (NUDIX family)